MSLDQFIRLADNIIEFEADLNDNQFPISSSHAISIHRNELKSIWTRLKETYEKFLHEAEQEEGGDDGEDDSDVASNIKTYKTKYKSTYITYCNCMAKLFELSDSLQVQKPVTVPAEVPALARDNEIQGSSSKSLSLNLPPIEIETFYGDYNSWPTFRDLFTAVIANSRASNVEKLFFLTQKTKGEAREIVQKSPLTNEGFEQAWKDLCVRYENRRVLVNGQLKILFNLSAIGSESSKALKQLQRSINSCISTLKLYKIDVSSWDPIFVFVCTNRLPENTLTLWEQQLKDKTAIPNWSELDEFLTNRYRTLESVSEIRSSNANISKINDTKSKAAASNKKLHSFEAHVSIPKCPLCPKDSHVIRQCPKFLKMGYQQRLSEIKKQGLCLNCFSKTHSVRNCSSKNSCFKCHKRHNTLLHKEVENANSSCQLPSTSAGNGSSLNINSAPYLPTNSRNIQSTSNSNSNNVQSCFATNSSGILLGTAWVNICNFGVNYQARALIDSGSEGTFISERMFNLLRLPCERTNAQISGLNNSISAKVQRQCTIILGSQFDSEIRIKVTALVVPHLSNRLPTQTLSHTHFSNIPDIPLADPKFYCSSKVDILIGGDIFPLIIGSGVKHNVCNSLIAQETVFGWILTGPISSSSNFSHSIVSHYCEISLDKEISKFWEVENLPKKNFFSISDQKCEDLYVRSTRRNSEGRYIVSLPFKDDIEDSIQLGHSRTSAMAQFFRNEARLIRSPNLKLDYDKVVQEYEELGHMCLVNAPSSSESSRFYYLPHHAVIKPESTTTKVRVVFNASAPSSNGKSLNSLLYAGPILQNDLTLLILRWRFFKFVFNADIQKMYRQILVNPEHTSYQRILFRKNPNDPISDYELKTVTFGVNCAPYLAIRTLLQLADDVQSTFPNASAILRDSMYVDDVLAGSHTKIDAISARNDLIQALESAGFSLRKWTSNSKDILSDILPDHRLHEDFLKFEDSSSAKTLGVRWNACSDEFYFAACSFDESAKPTKREVLSQVAKLFDPAGWLAPCVIVAKILMQKIWVDGTGWDEELAPDSLQQWKFFQSNYSYINSIRIPRWVDFCPKADVQFHGFCDASEKAYAAALYIRVEVNSAISTHLVMSKTKVAPIKTLSIPRLELCGAVLLAEMIENILPRMSVTNFKTYCWTDSTIVLSWLSKPPCSWLTFVANRVSKITQVIDFSQWRHVISEENPADFASRGLKPQDLINNDLWWHGPSWLKCSVSEWPIPQTAAFPTIELEAKKVRVHFAYFSEFEDLLERFSSFHRAMRVLAYVYRFFLRTHPKFRSRFFKNSLVLSSFEINSVRDQLITVCQKAFYPNEYRALEAKKYISSSSSILTLNPFLDAEGIIRSRGRLENSPGLSYNEKHPIIIPYGSQFARLLVKFVHDISLHGGNQLVLRLLRSQFWIPKAKNLIKTILNKCKVCVIYKRRCQKQIMAALPSERVEISRPFTHTGIDFAGPFEIKSYSGRACRISKGYVCLFVCFSTKAIHLEATSDLSTEAFLGAFSRFVSRRGCPLHLHSDNGTNFVGASRVLSREFIQTLQLRITSGYAHQNITWHFIPAGAPHMGGLWEAGVKSFKTHFRKIAGIQKYTFEEFSTLLAKIEACLNSRPLSPSSSDPTDLCPLTPGHFLIGTSLLTPVDPKINDSALSITNRWQKLKLVHQTFCSRWKNEYLNELNKRNKWKKPENDILQGSLVVIKEENLPPNSWRLGRVVKLYYGLDSRVRVADIFTQKGVITRPVVKLIVLPTEP